MTAGDRGTDAPDVSAVIVNFNSADFALGSARSLLESAFTVEGRRGRIEIVIVDNASRGPDVERLRRGLGDAAVVLGSPHNAGYGPANNQGLRVTRGRYHLVINPDTRVLQGALDTLVSWLEAHPGVAAVGPLAFMDEDLEVLLPPNEIPTPEVFALQARAQASADAALENDRRRTPFALRFWTAREPMELEMLSGGCFLARRDDLLGIGGFDPGYPLYYEDTDLFVRLRAAVGPLVHLPSARILHFFSRSAITHMKGAMHRLAISERRWFRRHYGVEGERVWRDCAGGGPSGGAAAPPCEPWPVEALPPSSEPPPLDPGTDRPFYVEIAGNPLFTLAAAAFPRGGRPWRFGQAFWRQLGPGTYWARAVDRETLSPLRTWRITRCP